jgi:hypothetical protein
MDEIFKGFITEIEESAKQPLTLEMIFIYCLNWLVLGFAYQLATRRQRDYSYKGYLVIVFATLCPKIYTSFVLGQELADRFYWKFAV